MSERDLRTFLVIALFVLPVQWAMGSEMRAGLVVGWGDNDYGQARPRDGNDFVAVSAGGRHSLALKSDGSIVGWGDNSSGRRTPPDGNEFVAIAAGGNFSLALKSDGSIVGWGDNRKGQATPPDGNDFVAIAAGSYHSLALKSDGSIVGWGWNYYGRATPPDGNNFVAIAAGTYHSLARRDGSIVGWGWNNYGQTHGSSGVAIAAGGWHSLALKSDGSIVGWGANYSGQATPPSGNEFVAIAAGGWHSLALKSDGSIVGWGNNEDGQATPPAGNDFVAISAGWKHSLAIELGSPGCWDYFPGQCHGDSDNDGEVKGADFLALKGSWYKCYPEYNPCADFDRDGCVKGSDFLILKSNWYKPVPANCPPCDPYGIYQPMPRADMVQIPAGEFKMGDHYNVGDSDEKPVHTVYLDAFYISKYEITNSQYCEFLNSADVKIVGGVVYASSDAHNIYPYFNTSSADDESQITYSGGTFSIRSWDGYSMAGHPVVQVSWYGAGAYCNWLSQQEGYQACYNLSTWECDFSKHGYRLPTEAEWEYAARGGYHDPYYKYPWCSDTIDCSKANYDFCNPLGLSDYPYTSSVGYYSANYGLYDMAGNVWEWCNDWYDEDYYDVSPYDNPTGPGSGTYRVLRGGSWCYSEYLCRVAARLCLNTDHRHDFYGFRVTLDLNN